MRDSVAAIFPDFTASFEGRTSWLYLDIKGLPTVGAGNYLTSMGACCALLWELGDRLATQQEIRTAYTVVTADAGAQAARPMSQKLAAGSYAKLTIIRLPDVAIDTLITDTVEGFETILRRRFPGYDNLPADAQLGLLSMTWAMGPGFQFPKFIQALVQRNYATCAAECGMDASANPGLIPRNAANAALFTCAAQCGDPSVCHWPLPDLGDA